MENQEIDQSNTKSKFFADIQTGKPGIYMLGRALRGDEKSLIPAPSAISLIRGCTHVKIFANQRECIDTLYNNTGGEISREFCEGLIGVIQRNRRQIFKSE